MAHMWVAARVRLPPGYRRLKRNTKPPEADVLYSAYLPMAARNRVRGGFPFTFIGNPNRTSLWP